MKSWDKYRHVPFHKMDWNRIKGLTGSQIKFLLHFHEFQGAYYENFDIIHRKTSESASYRSQMKAKVGKFIKEVDHPRKNRMEVEILQVDKNAQRDDIVRIPKGLSFTDISGPDIKLILNPYKTSRQISRIRKKMENFQIPEKMISVNNSGKGIYMRFDLTYTFELPDWVFELSLTKRAYMQHFLSCGKMMRKTSTPLVIISGGLD